MNAKNKTIINDIIKDIKSLDEKLKTLAEASEDCLAEQHENFVKKYKNKTMQDSTVIEKKLFKLTRSIMEVNVLIENQKLLKQLLENMNYLQDDTPHGDIP